jgi:hypothetical protein
MEKGLISPICILEAQVWILAHSPANFSEAFMVILSPPRQNLGQYLKIRYDFLLHHFQFTVHIHPAIQYYITYGYEEASLNKL